VGRRGLAGAFGLASAGLVERARVQCRYGRVVARFDRVLASGMGGTLDGVEKEIPIPAFSPTTRVFLFPRILDIESGMTNEY
jgi:hypothetical protein